MIVDIMNSPELIVVGSDDEEELEPEEEINPKMDEEDQVFVGQVKQEL